MRRHSILILAMIMTVLTVTPMAGSAVEGLETMTFATPSATFQTDVFEVGKDYSLYFMGMGGEQQRPAEVYETLMFIQDRKTNKRYSCPDAIGLVEEVYFTHWKDVLALEMRDGGCNSLVFVELPTCMLLSDPVELLGRTELQTGRLVQHTTCVPVYEDPGRSNCIAARVYKLDKGRLELLPKESLKLTAQELGLEFEGFRVLEKPYTSEMRDLGPGKGLY